MLIEKITRGLFVGTSQRVLSSRDLVLSSSRNVESVKSLAFLASALAGNG